MNIILRHTLKSVSKNKLQAIVIFLTVVAVTMMMFAAFSMTGVFYNINVSEYRRMAGESDMLLGERHGGAAFAYATVDNVCRDNPDIEYVNYFLRGSSVLRSKEANYPVLIEATDLASFATPENGFYLVEERAAGEYPSALVSERFVKEFSVGLGSVIEVLSPISGSYVKFNVTHILEPKGFFGSSVANQIVVDLSAVDSMGLVNNAYIKFRDPSHYAEYSEKLKELLPSVNIEDALNEEEVRSIANNNTLLLTVAVVFITVIMMLILFSSYLIIAKTRMSEMVLFKAAGASPAQTVWILLGEVLFYGVCGSLLGVLLGRIVMGAAVESLLPYAAGAVTYEFWKFLVSFLLGVAVSVLSALSPMIRVAKKSIRELTQGEVKEVKKGKAWIPIALSVAVAAFGIAMLFVTGTAAMILLFASIPFLVLWLITALKYAVKLVSLLLGKLFRSGGAALAAKTAKKSGQVLSVASLISIVTAFAFMVVSTIDVVVVAVTPYNSRYSADIVLTSAGAMTYTEKEAARLKFEEIDGVTKSESFGSIDFDFRHLNGELISACTMISVSDGDGVYKVSNHADAGLGALFDKTERPLILNYDIAERLRLKVGDLLLLSQTERTSSVETVRYLDGTFTVIGIEYTATEWDRTSVMKMSDIVSDGIEFAIGGGIFLEAADGTFAAVRDAAEENGEFLALRYEDWFNAASKGLEGVVTLLRFAELLFAVIAMLGILNISIVAFLDRKREFSVYRLAGMDDKIYFRFCATEGFVAALSGVSTGFVVAFFINRLMPVLANLVSKFLFIPILPWTVWGVPLVAGALFFVLWKALSLAFLKTFKVGDFRTDRSMLT